VEERKKKVQILMSTYNGERYLREQLDSILNQTYSDVEILIRDDGSTDQTKEIIQEYVKRYDNIAFIKGDNIGAVKSFFRLIKKADQKADYYALSDQDDVWEKDKIERAVNRMEHYKRLEKKQKAALENPDFEKPLMYASALKVTDQDLNVLYEEGTKRKTKDFSFGNAMVENCCTGCTIVMNRALQKLAAKQRTPKCSMHDWWLYLLTSCFGKVLYDQKPSILYRQHEHNVIGMQADQKEKIKKKITGFLQGRNVISCQLMEFYRIYRPEEEHGVLLKQFLYAKKHPLYRMKLIAEHKVYRQEKINDIICRLLILTGSM
jgi:glycosyltransferase involved in cell wall biosynthesis